MKKIPLFLLLLACNPCLFSCNRPLLKEDYIRKVRDEHSGLRHIEKMGDYVFDLQFQPTEYVFLQRQGDLLDQEQQSDLMEELKGLQYYTLTIGLADASRDFIEFGTSSQKERERKIYYFSYPFQNDILLVEGDRKLKPVLFHFERSMDLKNSRTFMLGFETYGKTEQTVRLEVNCGLFTPAPISLSIQKSKQPKLKL